MHSNREWQERDGNQASFLLQKKKPYPKQKKVLKMSTSPFDKNKPKTGNSRTPPKHSCEIQMGRKKLNPSGLSVQTAMANAEELLIFSY